MNNYKKTVMMIKNKYRGKTQRMLIRYYNSDVFEKDLDNFLTIQNNAGEPVGMDLAVECLLESYINAEKETEEPLTSKQIREMA